MLDLLEEQSALLGNLISEDFLLQSLKSNFCKLRTILQ